MRRSVTEPEKKVVAARQKWRCSVCKSLLDSTYQVDHTVALMNGGKDHVSNMTAMCVSCHAKKTQTEHIERNYAKRSADGERTDVVVEGGVFVKCSVCLELRPASSRWECHKCPGRGIGASLQEELAQYAYTPKGSKKFPEELGGLT